MIQASLTHARLLELLDYDAETGAFRWKVRRSNVAAGSLAGRSSDRGYLRIAVNKKIYYAHRLAVFWMTGGWPSEDVDHRDMNGSNNAWLNLRIATRSQNNCNSGLRSTNSSGFKGASLTKQGRYRAQITHLGKNIYLGTYATAEEAHARYRAVALHLQGEFSRAA